MKSYIPYYDKLHPIYFILLILICIFIIDYFGYQRWMLRSQTTFLAQQLRYHGKTFIRNLPTYQGQGIVIPTIQDKIQQTMILLNMLNTINCKIPITIAVLSDTLSDSELLMLEETGQTILDVTQHTSLDSQEMNGPQLSAFALIYASYDDTIVLDPSIILLRNPTDIFETQQYQHTGTFFWKTYYPSSYWNKSTYNWITQLIPYKLDNNPVLQKKAKSCQCASFIAIKKSIHTKTLYKLFILNKHWDILFQHMNYNHDSFWMACELAREPYLITQNIPGIIGKISVGKLTGFNIFFTSSDKESPYFIDTPILFDTEFHDISLFQNRTSHASIHPKYAHPVPTPITELINVYKKNYHTIIQYIENFNE